MKRILLFLLVSFLFSPPLAAQDQPAEETGGRKFAVLIGVNDYTGGLRKLRYAKRDMEAFRDQLLKIGFEKENVFCLLSGEEFKDSPTKQNILDMLAHVLRLIKRGDTLFLAMSGHGVLAEGGARFCPVDTKIADLAATTIPISDIYDSMKECRATFKLMIVDACRNDPFSGKDAGDAAFQTLADPPAGCLLLQSCSDKELSYEDDELKHGIFSYYLIEGLSGKAANSDGKITLYGMVDYADEKTKRRAFDEHREWQTPRLRGDVTNFTIWEPPAKSGDKMELTIKGVKYAFRWCPAGTFKMGSPTSELGRDDTEKQHEVTLTKGFWMLETQVTQEMWQSVTGSNPSNFKDSKKLPVEWVSWNDCQDYVAKLNALKAAPAGYKFSLPTEAQWEYACRAGTTTAYCFGEYSKRELEQYAWYSGYKDYEEWKDHSDEVFKNGKTHPVGEKKANAWGLHDMHGNVWEWCLDYWDASYPEGSVTEPTGPTSGSSRVLRGGGWFHAAVNCRSAYRLSGGPAGCVSFAGLRLLLVRD